jgi:hydrogenase maturation protein HypF
LELVTHTTAHVLAVGAEQKSAPCFYTAYDAVLSEPLGGLADPGTYRAFIETIEHLSKELGFTPDLVAHDLHPLYQSTRFAEQAGLPTVAVQHHHAHVVSVMAEWRIDKPVIGICCDGVGYGADGNAWGCEVMRCDADGYQRLGFLDYFPLIGGDAAAIQTWRSAAALLRQAFGSAWRDQFDKLHGTHGCEGIPSASDLENADRLMERGVATVLTSSLGRVFDGVSFMLGLCRRNDSEGQAAIMLEEAAVGETVEPYPYETVARFDCVRMSVAPMIRAIVKDIEAATPIAIISSRFHETIARMLTATALMAAEKARLFSVVLAGGCFANQRLVRRLTQRLESRHFTVYAPRQISCGDAGLALGQAVIAGHWHQKTVGDPARRIHPTV